MTAAASDSFADAWSSPSAWVILARRSRSARARVAMAGCRFGRLCRCGGLACGRNVLGPPFPFRLRLDGNGALHLHREVNILDLDSRYLHAPRFGLQVDPLLQLRVDGLTVREQVIERVLTKNSPYL